MSFKPLFNKIEIKPLVKDSPLAVQEIIEAGEVIAISDDLTVSSNFEVKVGDIIFFQPHGCYDTAEYEGVVHHIVTWHSEFIHGYVAKE